MPRGKSLTDEERKEIYEARMLGESREEIARAYGIATASVTAIVRRYRQKEEGMAYKECIVAGNKKTGRLISSSDLHRYEGTCVVAGKAHSKTFIADNANIAAKMWREWCNELKEEHAQSANPQPTPKPQSTPKPEPVEQPVAHEPEKEEPQVKETNARPEGDNVYVIWTKGDSPRLFGAYLSMESALAEVDRLNDIASFLVSERVFEVEEVSLRS